LGGYLSPLFNLRILLAVIRSASMNFLIVNLAIPAEEFVRLYQGSAKVVIAKSLDGRQVKFPADILRPYVLHQGVYGQFKIHFDEFHKFKSIEKL
jgi:Protein of unknown function (DUF2835)